LLGMGKSNDKKEASKNAYMNALNNLKAGGVDSPWSLLQAKELDFKRIDIQSNISKAIEKRNEEGYIDWYFVNISKLDDEEKELVQLIGVSPEGRKYILGQKLSLSYFHGGDIMSVKSEIIKEYSESGNEDEE